MRPSFVKLLILRWLSEGPATGYELMKRYEGIFGTSSPGTIYPALSQLESKGLVGKADDGRYVLTEKGKAFFKELEEERARWIEEARKRLNALADVFDDNSLRRIADLMPVADKISPRVANLLSDLKLLVLEVGDDAVPVLERAVEELRKIKGKA